MSYTALRSYVKDIAESLDSNVLYTDGRKEVIHLLREAPPDNLGVVVWCLPFIGSGSFTEIGQQFNETVTVNIIFYKQDYQGSELNQDTPESLQDEIRVLYETKDVADEFVRKFNFNQINTTLQETSEDIEIQSVTFDNVIKDNDYLLTGTFVSMNITIPDDFNYCSFIS